MTEPTAPPVTTILPGLATPKPPADVQSILNSAMLVVGPSQSGKSSLLITLAEYIWATYRKVTLYYLIDGGGIPAQGEELVKRGILRLWRVRTRSSEGLTFETLQRVSQGWWPRKINPRTGETEPNVDLVPPVTESYSQYCAAGHLMKSVPFQSMLVPSLCPECKRIVGAGEWKIVPSVKRTRGFENIGGMVIDGLSSCGSWLMEDLSRRLDLGGEKGAMGPVVSGGMVFGSNNRAHYGSAQSRLNQMVLNALGIPGLVVPPVYTALIEEASDSGGLMVKAPVIPGSAKSSEVTQWFGDTIETRIEERDGKRYRQMRLQSWIEHTPLGSFRHLCGVRSYPARLPILIEEEEAPLGRPELAFQTFNLGYYLKLRDQAGKAIAAEYAAKYADAPGVEDGVVEYGEAVMEMLPSPSPAGVTGAPSVAPARTGPSGPLPVSSQPAAPAGAPVMRRRVGAAAPPAPAAAQAPPPAVAPPPAAAPPPPAVAAPAVRPAASPVVTGPAPNPVAPAAAPARAVVAPPPPGRRPQ